MTTLDQEPSDIVEQESANGASKGPQPKEALPTDRIAFEKQFQLLKAYAAASDDGAHLVSNDDVAKLVDMNSSTVSLANNFFSKMGFLIRQGRGFTPAREVVDYKRAIDWGAENAAEKLAPLVEGAWFAKELRAKLQMRPVEIEEALADLAQRAEVPPKYKPQLRMLVAYLEAVGLVRKEGTQLVLVRRSQESARPEPAEREPAPTVSRAPNPEAKPPSSGGINFNVSINIGMDEVATWPADRISAFFEGLAKAVAAQKGDKKES